MWEVEALLIELEVVCMVDKETYGGKITFDGGDGSSMEKAVLIRGVKDSFEFVRAQNRFITKQAGKGWHKKEQFLCGPTMQFDANRLYDGIEVETLDGRKRTFYFKVEEGCLGF